MRELLLSSGWQVKAVPTVIDPLTAARDDEGWVAASVPGLAHEALWAAGRLPDPYLARSHTPRDPRLDESFGMDFLYRCRFDAPPWLLADPAAPRLCCDGLDTVATVFLNGTLVLRSDNMFVPRRAAIGPLLRPTDNELLILFESALRTGRERQARAGERPVWNGDPSRVYVRKAQVHYGWDFGPALLSAGPWRPVRLCARPYRVSDVHAVPEVAPDHRSARIPIVVHVEAQADAAADAAPCELHLTLRAPGGERIQHRQARIEARGGTIGDELRLAEPSLWWPRGYGSQALYTLEVTLQQRGEVLDTRTLRLGLRRLRLVEEPLGPGPRVSPDDTGESFYFEVNGQPIFCGGANWIPADLLTTRVTPARIAALLDEAVAANMTMLRVWGGGLYEDDAFYDRCDELGLLVFQDFLFACGMYPAHDWFRSSVTEEATAAARRLRHHACLALWAGNNEDYAIAQSNSAYGGPASDLPAPAGPGERARFDGRRLYEETLPAALRATDAGPDGELHHPYWPGSPYSRTSSDPNDPHQGDRHIWEVWHQPMRDYQEYPALCGRFVSEFGMQAVPSRATLRRALGRETDALTVEMLALLNNGQDGPARIARYIERNLPAPRPDDVDGYLYATQLIQAESVAYAVRGFRRRFGPPGRLVCGGALVWQLNDLWPGVSWALLEHYSAEDLAAGRPVRRKPAFYALRRELAPLALGLSPSDEGAAVWAVRQGSAPCAPGEPARELGAELRLRAFTVDGTQRLDRAYAVTLRQNQVTELCELPLPPGALTATSSEPLIVGAELVCGGEIAARAVLWPQPLKALPLRPPELAISVEGDAVTVRAGRPAKGVLLAVAGRDGTGDDSPPRWQDNLLDLVPGHELRLAAPGLGGRPVAARSLFELAVTARGGQP